MVASWVIDILRCPETGMSFSYQSGYIVRQDGKKFKLHGKILSLISSKQITGNDKKMNDLYEKIAPYYNYSEICLGWLLTGLNMVKSREHIISLLDLKNKNQNILEVSPGPGVFQPLLRKTAGNSANIISLDLSMAMLKQCLKYSDLHIELIQANAQTLPFADNSFDVLFHFGAINLFNNPQQSLREFVRVTKPGCTIAWGDEHMYDSFLKKHPIRGKLLPKINIGFTKPKPQIPDDLLPSLENIKTHEVHGGLGYFTIATKVN